MKARQALIIFAHASIMSAVRTSSFTAEERIKILEERIDALTAVLEVVADVAAHKDRVKNRISGLEERLMVVGLLKERVKALEQHLGLE